MPATDAQIQANRQNALRSTGPKTPEGKEQSRQNALKHGLTGDGVVIAVEDAEEVERRFAAFRKELRPSTEVGLTLVRRAATLAVRMEKCADRELAAIEDRVVQAMAEVEAPEGTDPAELARLQAQAGRLAAFDTSKQACLARRYEAAAERGFFRSLKEFRLVEKQAKTLNPAPKEASFRQELGSFLETKNRETQVVAKPIESRPTSFNEPFDPLFEGRFDRLGGVVDVPMTIGKRR